MNRMVPSSKCIGPGDSQGLFDSKVRLSLSLCLSYKCAVYNNFNPELVFIESDYGQRDWQWETMSQIKKFSTKA